MEPLTTFYFSFGVGIAIFLAIVLFGERKRKVAHRTILLPLAQAMGGDVPRSLLFGRYCRLDFQGIEGRILLVPNSDTPMMILVLYTPLDFWLIVKWSNVATRAVSKHASLSSITTGDSVFDTKYVTNAGDKIRAQALLMNTDRRAAMDWLLSNGYWRFAGGRKKITVTMVGYTKAQVEPERLRESFKQLLKVVGKAQ